MPASDDADLNAIIVEGMVHPLVVLDSSFEVVRCNRRFQELFRLPEHLVSGFPLSQVLKDERLQTTIRQAIANRADVRETEFECEVEGECLNFLLSVSVIALPGGKPGALVTFDEVTEWKYRQAQVMEASRLVSIGEMAAGIAHEVNNPLAAVMGFAQLVLRRDLEDRVQRDIERILSESKRASKIITNLQSFARRYKPQRREVDVAQAVEKVLDFRAYELDVTNMKVVRHIEAGAPPIMGDEHQLEQVFLNILMNAEQFTYTANGGGTLTVSISHEGGLVKVSFKDDGPGIAKDDLPKIFDPFFTTKDVGKGTGLGLSICYGIVHEHNGVIRVDSAPGEGSEFVIEFPAARPEALAGATIQRMPSSVGHAPPRNLDVLIVEDEDAVAEVFARALSEDGHHVIVECDSSKALSVKDFQKYNVVVLDLKMPGVNGMTLFDHLAKQGPEIASRVLFVTGDALDPVAREFIDRTGNPLLVKPFSIGELVESVKSLSMKLASRIAAASPEGAAKAKS